MSRNFESFEARESQENDQKKQQELTKTGENNWGVDAEKWEEAVNPTQETPISTTLDIASHGKNFRQSIEKIQDAEQQARENNNPEENLENEMALI